MGQTSGVVRQPVYFEDDTGPLFGWWHAPGEPGHRDCVAVLCPAIGLDYTLSHRSTRHLADRLARRGIRTLRFDFHGSGDSPGSDLDPGRVEAWRRSVRSAVQEARRVAGRGSVCVIGVRLGATVAALASADTDIDLLVLWNPAIKGRTYVRELQAAAASAERPATAIEGAIEGGGFMLTAETADELRRIDLLQHPVRASRRALLLWRDDQQPDGALSKHLSTLEVAHDERSAPGWNAMMSEPQFSEVPDAALDAIVDWASTHSAPATPGPDVLAARAQSPSIPLPETAGAFGTLEETACVFGPDERLFGILTRPAADTGRPAVVLFNSGSVHHVGPHRLYVTLARTFAAAGFPCLRFDLEGIGDSVLRQSGRENHPYPPTATTDARSAFDFLRARFGYRRFVAVGLCSGAHTAFHAALEVADHEIADLVLLNPLTFRWQEGMSLETTQRFRAVEHYRQSLRDARFWKRLLSGQVALRGPILVMLKHVGANLRSYWNTLRETVDARAGSQLALDLRALFAMKRRAILVVSEGDPGYDILCAGARRDVLRALQTGDIRLERVAAADHTFSQVAPRAEVVQRLVEIMTHREATRVATDGSATHDTPSASTVALRSH